MAAAVPSAIRALTASLKATREPELRARLEVAVAGLRRLYAIPELPQRHPKKDRDMDLRKRPKTTARARARKHTRPASIGLLGLGRKMPPEAAQAYAKEWREKIALAERTTKSE